MKTFLLLVMLGNGADVTTSLVAFDAGAYEANPLVLSEKPAPFIAQAVIVTVAETWALNKLSKKHPKLAKGIAYALVGVSIGASINNGFVINRQHGYSRR